MSDFQQVPQFVLVLSTDGSPVYTAMARLAVASLRATDPNAKVVLICDALSAAHARIQDGPLAKEVNSLQVVHCPEGSSTFRSRWIKTQIRQLVQGPLLFLDLDVLVREELSSLFELDTDVAMALNHSRNEPARQIGRVAKAFFEETAWPRDPERYLNSGVIYMADTQGARDLGERWHMRWQEAWRTTGRHHDQTVLNSLLVDDLARVKVLDHRYNAQFREAPAVARDAAIWHFYASEEVDLTTAYGVELQRLLDGKALDMRRVRRLLKAPHPWRRRSFLDDRVAEQVMKLNATPDWADAWFRGDAGPTLRKALHKLMPAMTPRPS